MKAFILSFVVLGIVLAAFGHLISPRLVKVVIVEKPITKIETKVKVVKPPLNWETKQALNEYYLKHYGMRYLPQ